jgi:hypothetical protein
LIELVSNTTKDCKRYLGEYLRKNGWKISHSFYVKENCLVFVRVIKDKDAMPNLNDFEARYCNVHRTSVELYGPSTTVSDKWVLYRRETLENFTDFEKVLREVEADVHSKRGRIAGAKFGF